MTERIDAILAEAQRVKEAARQQATRINTDPTLSRHGRAQRLEDLRQKVEKQVTELRKTYAAAIGEERERLTRSLAGQATSADLAQALAAKEDPKAFARLVEAANVGGDRSLAAALRYVAAATPALRRTLPEADQGRYAPLDDFEQSPHGSQGQPTQKFGVRMMLGGWNPPPPAEATPPAPEPAYLAGRALFARGEK